MATSQKTRSSSVRVGKNLKLRLVDLEVLAAKHDAEHQPGVDVQRPTLGKLNDLMKRFPSSAIVPPHVAIPLSKKDHARLSRLAEKSGLAVESLLALWVRQRLARCS